MSDSGTGPTDETALPEEKGEWRHGWFRYHWFGCDWRDWGLALGVNFHYRKEWGVWLAFGPLYWHLGYELEDRLFIDGKDSECAVSPVDGYA